LGIILSLIPFIQNERFTPPVDGHDTTGEFDPAVHGFNGINSVTLSGFRHQVATRVIEASKSMGNDSDYRFVLDMNSGNQLGVGSSFLSNVNPLLTSAVGFGQSTVLNGARSSSATSYLGPQFINRPNLHVLLHAYVTRILPTSDTGTALSFGSVEFSQDSGGKFSFLSSSAGSKF